MVDDIWSNTTYYDTRTMAVNSTLVVAKPAMSTKRQIWVRFQREGIHCYPAAATDPNLADVSFLAHPHRHIFHFVVSIDVEHNDRDIEFIQLKRWLESLYSKDILELDHKSCEMIAEELAIQINEKYPHRNFSIDVSEDNENGAKIDFYCA